MIAAVGPAAAGQSGWAHQATGFQSNGAVTVKSLAGGAYVSTGNPSGAIAKPNQSATTQGPTVIIQATSGGYGQIIPLFKRSATIASCPPGYTSLFATTSATWDGNYVFNIGGTRFTFGRYSSLSNGQFSGWLVDNIPLGFDPAATGIGDQMGANGGSPIWNANLCAK